MEDWLQELGHEVVGPASNLGSGLILAACGDAAIAVLDLHLGAERSDMIADVLTAESIPFAFATGRIAWTVSPLAFSSALSSVSTMRRVSL